MTSSTNNENAELQLVDALTSHSGNVAKAARSLGVTRMQIHRWAKRFAVNIETFREDPKAKRRP
jgi:sigma-54 dependent transcriptional regulator, acetoin dehydrogenase operon transcriptional activator AcoR